MSTPRCPLLGMPAEVRLMIYRFYVATPGGYCANFETGKLRRRDKAPIDLSLMYTCKSVAEEMRGLALNQNTVHFSTETTLRNDRERLSRCWECSVNSKYFLLKECLQAGLCPEEARNKMERELPGFAPTADQMSNRNLQWNSWSPLDWVPSLFETACKRMLDHIIAEADPQLLKEKWPRKTENGDLDFGLLNLEVRPWAVPTAEFMATIPSKFTGTPFFIWLRLPKNSTCRRVSAAAAAIRCLDALPPSTRLQLRKVTLDEDMASFPYPECHAQGLIQFCAENPDLRVERRLNLWSNCAARSSGVTKQQFSVEVCGWIAEAHALPLLGMPPQSFTLVLDGNPFPHRCTELFSGIVQRDVAWARALRLQQYRPRFDYLRDDRAYWSLSYSCLPQAMADIEAGKSNIVCNFDPGKSWSMSRLVAEYPRRSSSDGLSLVHDASRPPALETAPPMVELETLRPRMLDVVTDPHPLLNLANFPQHSIMTGMHLSIRMLSYTSYTSLSSSQQGPWRNLFMGMDSDLVDG